MSRTQKSAPTTGEATASSVPGPEAPVTTEQRIEEIHNRVVLNRTAEVNGMLELLGSSRRLMWTNFLAGLARGVGFFLGVSIVGAVVLGILALVVDRSFKALGSDITLKSAVTSAYYKFAEIQDLIAEAQRDIDSARAKLRQIPQLHPGLPPLPATAPGPETSGPPEPAPPR